MPGRDVNDRLTARGSFGDSVRRADVSQYPLERTVLDALEIEAHDLMSALGQLRRQLTSQAAGRPHDQHTHAVACLTVRKVRARKTRAPLPRHGVSAT